jgi:outer membrane protein assembly factor BamB
VRSFALVPILFVAFLAQAPAQRASISTRNYNSERTGANTAEPLLNVANVNPKQFGRLFLLPVDDEVYAGLLYLPAVSIAGGTHNVLFAATVNNTVYAFDADSLQAPLWQRNFNGAGRPTRRTEVGGNCGKYQDFGGNIGIIGTPVIDASALTMYFVTRTVEPGGTVQRLHALDATTGEERPNSPRVIEASVPGTGEGGESIAFNAMTQNQRPALALSQGVVYVAWASFCDTDPYHGWIIGFDASTLETAGTFNSTPNGSRGGIWMAGAGMAFDGNGNLYVATGNGDWDGATGFGESMLRLTPGTLQVADFFTPSNFNSLNMTDLDFGSSGPVMVPGTDLLTAGGKEGKIYLLKAGDLGHEAAGDTQIPQSFQAVDLTLRPGESHHIHNAAPWWQSPDGANLYVWGENDYLHAFRLDPAKLTIDSQPFANGSVLPPYGMPGGLLTLSANGSQSGSGIVWATVPRFGDASNSTVPGVLYAFNAETLELLWSSTGVNDDSYNFTKGSPPVVANGKVYAATLSRLIAVYGLRQSTVPQQNLAYLKKATGTTPCTSNQGPDKAVNGSYSGGLSDEFCSAVPGATLTIDLGATYRVNRFVVEHGGAGGDGFDRNSVDFIIEISTNGTDFTAVVGVKNNQKSITTHDIGPANARYVRLRVSKPSQVGDPATRIYEFQVFGSYQFLRASVTPGATPICV